MLTEITKAQMVCLRLASLRIGARCVRSTFPSPSATTCRRRSISPAIARDMLGANGIVNEYPVIRHMLNLETVNTYEGTFDVHTLILGRDITGASAFD